MKYFALTYFITIVILLDSCCKDCNGCGESPTAFQRLFYFYVYEKKTNETIVGHCTMCPYSEIGSVLVDQKGDTIRTEGTINSGGGMRIQLIKMGRDSTNYPIHREYYLHLVDFNGIEQDIDTFTFNFTLVETSDCNKYDFKNFRCYFNDSLYFTSYPWSGGAVKFYK
jgi:hypothetical protein